MKLSCKPRHFAPGRRTRDLQGKLHNPVALTNSNRPGGRWSERRSREGFFSALRKKTIAPSMINAAVKLITGARGGGKKALVIAQGDK